jgi:hypothetical protein
MPFFRLPQPEQFPGGALFHAIVGRVGTDVLPAASPWQAAQCSIAYPTPPPQTEMPGRLQAHFAERGIRMMQQRRAILCVMEAASIIWMPARFCGRRRKSTPASIAAPYRTLRLLKRQGLLTNST